MRPATPPPTRFYAVLTLPPALLLLRHAANLAHSASTARHTLHLLTALPLLLHCHRPRRNPPAQRLPVLAAFLLSFVHAIAAALSLLAAADQMVNPSPPSPRHHPLLAARLVLAIAFYALVQPEKACPGRRSLRAHAAATALALAAELAPPKHPSAMSVVLDVAAALAALWMLCPVLIDSGRMLLQAAPDGVVASVKSRREAVMAMDGVLSCGKVRVWEETAGVVVGTLCVIVEPGVSKSWVLDRTVETFDGVVDDLTVQVESWREGGMETAE